MKILIASTALILSYCYSFSQIKPRISFGNLDTTRVSVEEFNSQTELIIQKGFITDSAVAYFSGAGFSTIGKVEIAPKLETAKFFKLRKLIMPGSAVTFDVYSTELASLNHFRTTLTYLFYSEKRNDSFFIENRRVTEWKRLRELKYLKGTIYFSGSLFPNVITFSISATNIPELKLQFDRFGPGSQIIFDNVQYLDVDNKIKPLNMPADGYPSFNHALII